MLVSVLCHAATAQGPQAKKSSSATETLRTLHFPKGAIGRLFATIKDIDSIPVLGEKSSGLAQGDVQVPQQLSLGLKLHYEGTIDFTWAKNLQPDDICVLDSNNIPFDGKNLQPLSRLTGLKTIRFDYADLSDANLEYLKDCSNLSYLGMCHTMVEGDGLARLKHLSKLKTLHLSCNSLDENKLAALQNFPELARLQIQAGGIGDQGLLYISKSRNLVSLELDRNKKITDQGIEYLTRLPKLQLLNISGSTVTSKCFASLKKMKSLRHLCISSPNLSEAELAKLSTALKPCIVAYSAPARLSPALFAPLH